MKLSTAGKSLSYAVAVLAGVGSALALQYAAPRTDASAFVASSEVQSIEQLGAVAHVIVTGTLGHVAGRGYFNGYDKSGQIIAVRQRNSQEPSAGLPYVDYEVYLERALLDDGRVKAGKPLVLRLIADEAFTPGRGYRQLFFLTRNPDGQTYGIEFRASLLDISGDRVRAPLGAVPAFARDQSPDALLARVQEYLSKQR
jgi:hypothetical protein